jgi:hypothetical protein
VQYGMGDALASQCAGSAVGRGEEDSPRVQVPPTLLAVFVQEASIHFDIQTCDDESACELYRAAHVHGSAR